MVVTFHIENTEKDIETYKRVNCAFIWMQVEARMNAQNTTIPSMSAQCAVTCGSNSDSECQIEFICQLTWILWFKLSFWPHVCPKQNIVDAFLDIRVSCFPSVTWYEVFQIKRGEWLWIFKGNKHPKQWFFRKRAKAGRNVPFTSGSRSISLSLSLPLYLCISLYLPIDYLFPNGSNLFWFTLKF